MTLALLEGFGSPIHWIILLVVALLIFGRRLPEVGRSLGKGITEFKKGLKDAGEEISGQPQDPYASNANQAAYSTPARPPQQYQQQPPQQLPPQQYAQPAPPPPPAMAGQQPVRVSRQDMVD